MKSIQVILLTVGVICLGLGVYGTLTEKGYMMGDSITKSDYATSQAGSFMGQKQMMWNYNNDVPNNNKEVMSIEDMIEEVKLYIGTYDEPLEIADIFIFENSDYYVPIIESETNRGAMELLVNPYTGNIYPEYGPNMMWNLKYGMHNTESSMYNNPMMSRNNRCEINVEEIYTETFNLTDSNDLTPEEAYNKGELYLETYGKGLQLDDAFHSFYGYYTFHILEDGQISGMLSVNGLSGDVWYHDWHGEVVEVIEEHVDNH